MKTSHLIILLGSAAALVALFAALYLGGSALVLDVVGEQEPSGALASGAELPYFDLPDLAGGRVRSTDFPDTPLVIVFWATWNAQAADEMHILDEYLASGSAQSRLVKVVAINSQEEKSIVSSFMSRGGYGVTALLDTQGLASERYAVKSLPTFYFADRTGAVRETYAGMLSQQALMNKVEKILQ